MTEDLDDQAELEDLFSEEETEALTKADHGQYHDLRDCTLAPPLNPNTGLSVWTPKQLRVIRSTAPYLMYLAGIGSGKSLIGLHSSVLCAAHNPFEETMVGAPIVKSITGNIYPYVRQLLNDFYARNHIRLEKRWWRTDKVIELINGHRFSFRTFSDPDSLRGPSLSQFWGDEISSTEEVCSVQEDELLDILFGRMRGGPRTRWLRMLLTTTPKGNRGSVAHWVKEITKGNKNYEIVSQTTMENVALPPSYLETLKAKYSARFYRQEVLGQILDLSDAYFADVIDHRESFIDHAINPDQILDVGIDWGEVHPVAVLSQEVATGEGIVDVITGSIGNKSTNDDLIREICNRFTRHKIKRARLYPDPADMEAIRDLRRALERWAPSVECEIHYTRKMTERSFSYTLRKLHDRFGTMDGKRKILFRRSLQRDPDATDSQPVVWCFLGYRIDPVSGKAPAKSPYKHIVDAFRYTILNKYLRFQVEEK